MPNLIGSMNLDGTLKGIISGGSTFTGKLSNPALRGYTIELQIDGTVLQYRHEDENVWHDLIDINEIDYNELMDLPTIDGIKFTGDMTDYIITPQDELSNTEVQRILNS